MGLQASMAFLGSLGPLQPLGSAGRNPQSAVCMLRAMVHGTLRPLLAPKNGQKDPRTQIDQEPQSGYFSTPGLWQPPEAASSS
ncbi:hypothetical protein O181_003471 [Austropuccinia psidii MF-1]|uniref:Uncharacterized protein n=1 Tax=Austropuccinia psidii MF-1 TaxID=1389203 RepID=A0A9Q3BDU4_9BASI|nr:hypothetical protein [Austropuccinia psidii MF-1]